MASYFGHFYICILVFLPLPPDPSKGLKQFRVSSVDNPRNAQVEVPVLVICILNFGIALRLPVVRISLYNRPLRVVSLSNHFEFRISDFEFPWILPQSPTPHPLCPENPLMGKG
jgi:hypothetical protein